ncbi:MAG: response regulator [Anaerolineae bacterium]|nr:response regulator [Anaerolineae bacterium]
MAECILIVEDDVGTRHLFQRLLERAGYQVLQAGTAGEASLLLTQQPPDLILLDLMLPETSGVEFLKFVRETPHIHDIKVVVVTAHYRFDSPYAVEGFIQKPVTSTQLLQTIQSVLVQ